MSEPTPMTQPTTPPAKQQHSHSPSGVLVACERSGKVRDALRARGIRAYSCDLEEDETGSPYHLRGDVRDYLEPRNAIGQLVPWAGLIAFPPCTDLASSGARWFSAKRADGRQQRAIAFARLLFNAPIEKIALENPIGVLSTALRKPDQIVQPWQFGHGEVKATCFWLKNLPPLVPTKIVAGREARVWRMGPSPTRAIDRSRTYDGIAAAMAEQWGGLF